MRVLLVAIATWIWARLSPGSRTSDAASPAVRATPRQRDCLKAATAPGRIRTAPAGCGCFPS